jgi:hypothetical protein
MEAAMFKRLLSGPILSRIIGFAPVTPMLARMHGLEDEVTVRTFLETVQATPARERLQADVFDDMIDLRDMGRLGAQICIPGGRLRFLEDWNRFVDGDDDASLMASVTGPVMAMIDSEAIRVATLRKQARGPILKRHLEAAVDLAAIHARSRSVEEDLRTAIRTGTSADWHVGHMTTRMSRGEAQVLLEDFKPVVELRRKGAVSWHRAQVRPLSDLREAAETSVRDPETALAPGA